MTSGSVRSVRDPRLHLLALLCVLVAGSAVFSGNWVGGHEGYAYLWRAAEVQAQLELGTLWPRWCPDFYWGYGYPFFVFYPPGVFVLGALLGQGVGLILGLGLTAMLGSAALFYGTRRLALLWTSEVPARAAAVLATLAIYRFVQVSVRGDYAESVATGVLPWVLTEAVLLTRTRSLQQALAPGARLAMGIGALSMLHALTAVLGCAVVAVVGLVRWRSVLRVAVPALAGLVLGAAFWLPVAAHAPMVRFDQMVEPIEGATSYLWSDHFPTLAQRFTFWLWGFGGSLPGPEDGMSMATALVGWLVVAGAVTTWWRRRGSGAAGPLGATLLAWAATQVLMTPASSLLWEHVPGLAMFQFPWRLLALDLLLVALLAALTLEVGAWRPRALAGGLVGLAFLGALPISLACLRHAQEDPYPFEERGLAALEDPRGLQTLGRVTGDGAVPITTALRDEYLPKTVQRVPSGHPGGVEPGTLGPAQEQEGAWRRWVVRVPEAGPYRVSWFWFPGVAAAVQGEDVPTRPSAGRGLVELDLPAGDVVVDVWWEGTWATQLGALLAALGWAAALGLVGWRRGGRALDEGGPAAQVAADPVGGVG